MLCYGVDAAANVSLKMWLQCAGYGASYRHSALGEHKNESAKCYTCYVISDYLTILSRDSAILILTAVTLVQQATPTDFWSDFATGKVLHAEDF